MAEKKELLTIKEVAEILGMQPSTIYKWAQEKMLPAIKMGRTWRFRRTSINLWLAQREEAGSIGSPADMDDTSEETAIDEDQY